MLKQTSVWVNGIAWFYYLGINTLLLEARVCIAHNTA